MKGEGLTGIPLYPEPRNCPSPSAPRILEISTGVQRHHLVSEEALIQVFEPRLDPLQQKVPDLLHIRAAAYTSSGAS